MAIGSTRNIENVDNVVRLYSRRLYDEKITIGDNDSERAETYRLMARGQESMLKDTLNKQFLVLSRGNAQEFANEASSGWEKAGDHSKHGHKKAFYYRKALQFAKELPEEDRKAKELRIDLKMKRNSSPSSVRIDRDNVVIDMNAYRKEKDAERPKPTDLGRSLRG